MMPWAVHVTLIIFVVTSCALDVRTRRIPNALSAPAMLIGIGLNVLYFGTQGLIGSVAGIVLMIGILLWPFALGGIGGGDVKMMGAVGALIGPRLALIGLTAGIILGGVIMLAHLVRCGRAGEKIRSTRDRALAAVLDRSLAPLRMSASDAGTVVLPYSVPLGLGALATVALTGLKGTWT